MTAWEHPMLEKNTRTAPLLLDSAAGEGEA